MDNYKEEYKRVVGKDDVTTADYITWLERKVASLEGRKRTIFRDDLVLYAGKLWRVDWFEGSTLGISNTAGEHKEVGEGAVRLLSSWFRDKPVEDMLP